MFCRVQLHMNPHYIMICVEKPARTENIAVSGTEHSMWLSLKQTLEECQKTNSNCQTDERCFEYTALYTPDRVRNT